MRLPSQRYGFAALAIVLPWILGGVVRAATVEVDVANVKRATGHVRAALCPEADFLKQDCPYSASAPAREGETVVTFENIPAGQYAAQVFDDESDGGVVHQDALGVPREGVGFSNDAPIHAKGPQFSDAAFVVGEGAAGTKVHVTLRYFSVRKPPSGPAASPQ